MKHWFLFSLAILLFISLSLSVSIVRADNLSQPEIDLLDQAGYRLIGWLQNKAPQREEGQSRGDAQMRAIIGMYTEAIRQNPDNATAYSQRAFAYTMIGAYDLAIHDYSSAVKVEPLAADSYKNRAIVYERLGDFEAALRDYETFASLIAAAPTARREHEREWVGKKITQIMSHTHLARIPDSELPKPGPPEGSVP